jgi:cytochrome c biogenesis protein ResB
VPDKHLVSPSLGPGFLTRVLRALGSSRATAIVAAAGAAFLLAGSLIPQTDLSAGAEAPTGWAGALGLDALFQSRFFAFLLAAAGVHLAAATWTRVPKAWRLRPATDGASAGEPGLPCAEGARSRDLPLSPRLASAAVRRALALDFSRVALIEGPETRLHAGERNFWSRWSVYLAHFGLLLLLAAAGLKAAFGFSAPLRIEEGARAAVPVLETRFRLHGEPLGAWKSAPALWERKWASAPFEIALERFDLRMDPSSGQPVDYRSDVAVQVDGRAVETASIRVNTPLEYGGLSFHQTAWGYASLASARLAVGLPEREGDWEINAPFGQRLRITGTPWELRVAEFLPDAQWVAPGRWANEGDTPENPALRLELWKRGRAMAPLWILLADPVTRSRDEPGLSARILGLDPVSYSVLTVRHDPGWPLAAAGALATILGAVGAFYFPHRRAWVRVSPAAGGSHVEFSGWGRGFGPGSPARSRWEAALDREWAALGEAERGTVSGSGSGKTVPEGVAPLERETTP